MRRRLLASLIVIWVVAILGVAINALLGNSPELGLDLQGGASVTLQAEGDYEDEALDVAVDVIRQRVDALGVAEPEIVRQGDTIVVNLPGVKDQRRAIELVGRTGAVQLRPVLQELPGADTEGGATTTTVATDDSATSSSSSSTTAASTTTAAPTTTSDAASAGSDAEASTTTEGATTTTEASPLTTTTDDPLTTVVLPDGNGNLFILGPAGGTGEVFSRDASATIQNGEWVVDVGLRGGAEGLDIWNALATKCYVGAPQQDCPTGRLAIVLDGVVISAPTVNEPEFSDRVLISGSFTEGEARDLAKILEFGAVPVRLEPAQAQVVSATLGTEALHAAVVAGIVGIVLLLIYLFLYYRALTVVIVGGLVLFGLITWSVIAMLGATRGLALTLSGAAGIIVSIGITVDSYVVYFERLKDEVQGGRSLRTGARRGFESAWRTIWTADLVSLIGAVVLWYLTVGSVRGFAFFLGLATICDMIVAYFYTRPAVLLLAQTRWVQGRRILGVAQPGGAGAPAAAAPRTGGAQ
jgi:preprotein translocase subunit SecD